MRLPGIGFTSASCSAYSIQNGVRLSGTPPRIQPGPAPRSRKRKPHLAFRLTVPPWSPDRQC